MMGLKSGAYGSHGSYESHTTHRPRFQPRPLALRARAGLTWAMAEGDGLPPHGGYRGLAAYQSAEIIYDATVVFCRRFFRPPNRTIDQMVQAARSGKQNIAEGSMASGTSREIELKLIGIARASLEELLLNYEDFLRENNLELWPKDHPKAVFIRAIARQEDKSYAT